MPRAPNREDDTIAALATPVGEGGLAVIRLSGASALQIAAKGFRGKQDLGAATTQTAHVGEFLGADERKIDDVVAVVFRQPGSYTGEDVVEISCHGGVYVSEQIVRALLEFGARHAAPGEFTKRAFLNGKLDLSQAEAVADLIHSRASLAHQASLQQLDGSLSAAVQKLRERLVNTNALLELELDFAEDGYEFVDRKRITEELEEARQLIERILGTYQTGRLVREGVKVVITGSPNVGKSSLLNRLLGEERAIVTDIAGTTRDTIEETVCFDGLAFQVTDTAGLRPSPDLVEKEGIRRAEKKVRESDLILLVLDSSRPLSAEDIALGKKVTAELKTANTPAILVLNKSDLPDHLGKEGTEFADTLSLETQIRISCVTGEGIEELRTQLVHCVAKAKIEVTERSVLLTNSRHYGAFVRAGQRLDQALGSVKEGRSSELIAVDLRGALEDLGEIIGEVTSEDILNSIFSRFCIGK